MAGACVFRCLVVMVLAGLTCGVVLATAAPAQEPDELARLGREVNRLHGQGKYADAIPVAERYVALARQKHGDEHTQVATALAWLGFVYQAQGRYPEAEPLFRRCLAIREKALGPDHPEVAAAFSYLAALYQHQARYAEAEPLHRRSLAIHEKARGTEHPDVGMSLNNLATLYWAQGRYAEAEPLYRRSLAIREKALGPDHLNVGSTLSNLAVLYSAQGRYAEAEPLYRRSLAIRERALRPDHPEVAVALSHLAGVYQDQGLYAKAEPLYQRSLAIREKALGPEHPAVGNALSHLASLYQAQGRYAEAEPPHKRSLAVYEKALGSDHPELGATLNGLAGLYRDQGRYAEAEPLYKRDLAIIEKALGAEHPDMAMSLSGLAFLALAQRNWGAAADYWRRSTGVLKRRAERGLAGAAEGLAKGEAQRWSWQFSGLIQVAHQLAAPSPTTALTSEMFETAQWAQASEAAASLAQMAARSARGSGEFAGLVRERQDLVREWQAKDKLLIAAKTNDPAKRSADAEQGLADRLAAIDTRLAAIDRRLAQEFPDYAALASPAPASVAEVQAQLDTNEALVLLLDTRERRPLPEESFVWVVTKTEVRWVRSDLGTAALTRVVAALRCGLDAAAWDGGAERCSKALGIANVKEVPQLLAFDHARAYKLYTSLFGEVQDLIKDKHLLIVPSGPLTQLPFHALVTRPPTSGDHPGTAWLAREHAVTVLPAVSSLKALRRIGKPSTAPRPMIGIGNPLLDGPDVRSTDRAKLARARHRCPETLGRWKVTVTSHRASVARVETRGGLADLAYLKALAPLPETADELCEVAQDVKADLARDIRLGSRATEREVKRLSASGELAKYKLVHFATHGALAGELDGTHEPGLILTPPDTATEDDDGYLSASEIAALKLDADWVVLSACNTAAGGATNAEALSGLGRAFIYAGARSLLVSHWAVYSDATVKLVKGAVREMSRNAKVGRAEAMRRSMLALIDKGTPEEAHPAFWAPFVVVGEGAAGR
jgi:CHAT domain-containing protein/Tfp pilus assembly protein PilF